MSPCCIYIYELKDVYSEMLLIVFQHFLSVEMAFFCDLLWPMVHILPTCDLSVTNIFTDIKLEVG
jgi:hypothetical protein